MSSPEHRSSAGGDLESQRPLLSALHAGAWMLTVMGILFVLVATASATKGLSLLLGLGLSGLIGHYVRRQILQPPPPNAAPSTESESEDRGAGWRDPAPGPAKQGDFLRQSVSCVLGVYGLTLVLSPLVFAAAPIAVVLPIWVFITGLAAWRTLQARQQHDGAAVWFGYAWGLLLVASTAAALAVALGGSMLH